MQLSTQVIKMFTVKKGRVPFQPNLFMQVQHYTVTAIAIASIPARYVCMHVCTYTCCSFQVITHTQLKYVCICQAYKEEEHE